LPLQVAFLAKQMNNPDSALKKQKQKQEGMHEASHDSSATTEGKRKAKSSKGSQSLVLADAARQALSGHEAEVGGRVRELHARARSDVVEDLVHAKEHRTDARGACGRELRQQ
jgi:hypothetical protein